jgi:hypothetical protein
MKAALPRPLGHGIIIIQNLGFSPIWALNVAKAKDIVSMIPRPKEPV